MKEFFKSIKQALNLLGYSILWVAIGPLFIALDGLRLFALGFYAMSEWVLDVVVDEHNKCTKEWWAARKNIIKLAKKTERN